MVSDMLVLAAVGIALCAAGAVAWFHARSWRRLAADPAHWPPSLSRPALTRYANQYLRADGWERLPAWEYADVQVRASRGGVDLNLFVVDDSISNLRTVMSDTAEKGILQHAVVGALTRQTIEAGLRREAEASGVFVLNPTDLPQVDSAIRRARACHEKWRLALLKP
jgi:hypothetical protein